MGEGRGGGDAEDASLVKKEPSAGVRDRARTLRHQMTEAERRLWQILRLRQTEGHRFRRQVPIGPFIADFVCHEARLIVELDGGQHDPSSEAEASRTRFLEGEGYRVLRFWNNEVLENAEGVRSAIAENLHPVTPTLSLPHRGGGPEATPEDVADLQVENRRLREELREALARQAAISEIVQIINSSPGNLAPVFDTMLERAMRLCEADFGIMLTLDGAGPRIVAERGVPQALTDFVAQHPPDIGPDTFFGRAVLGRSVLHTPDMRQEAAYRSGQPLTLIAVDLAGVRALLMAPLLKDGGVLGVFAIFRREVRSFTDKEIGLLQNFAAQAVIAMENARLLIETREALEQQTATAEVLQVINSSPGDLVPVFDAILEKAHALCEAAFGTLMIRDGQRFYAAVLRGVPPPFEEVLRRGFEPYPCTPLSRLLSG